VADLTGEIVRQPASIVAVVPIKAPARAKMRLELPARTRQQLALAFALDTVAAATGSGVFSSVLVVTSDPRVRQAMRRRRVTVVAEKGTAGLAGAVHEGCRWGRVQFPGAATLVVPSDLPSMTAKELAATVSRAVAYEASFVRDAFGKGTTLLYRSSQSQIRAHYGPGSAALHLAAGAEDLEGVAPAVRHDIDTLADLAGAMELGVGATTRAVVAAHRPILWPDARRAWDAEARPDVRRMRPPKLRYGGG
jgi:2-phospho-L-lactate guanylyltransferase